MKTEPNDQDIVKACNWYTQHNNHVDTMVSLTDHHEYPPCGSDCHHPELWKAEHWKWLLMKHPTSVTRGGKNEQTM